MNLLVANVEINAARIPPAIVSLPGLEYTLNIFDLIFRTNSGTSVPANETRRHAPSMIDMTFD